MFDRNKNAGQTELESSTTNEPQESRKPNLSTTSMPRAMAVIGATVHVTGDITSEENLIIEGQVDGTINLKGHELVIGQSGTANANISAKIIKVDGHVQGDLVGKEKVIISKTGNAKGNIVAPTVILEEGGKFKGSIDMGQAPSSASETTSIEKTSAAKPSRIMTDASSNESSSAAKQA